MFAIGDRVRTKVMNPSGHTRLPAYLRGRPGIVVWDLGPLPFADARAAGDVAASQRAFTVRFANPDVWGTDADPHGSVCADLYASYLEPE